MVDSENRMDFSPDPIASTGAGLAMVPRYTLYGDTLERPNWFVNVETMERRFQERGWTIKPHTHPRMTQLAFCARGGGQMTIDGETVPFSTGCVMVVPPHRIHGFDYDREAKGWVVSVETLYLEELLRRAPELRRVVHDAGVFALSGDDDAQIGPTIRRLEDELVSGGQGGVIGAEIQLLSLLLLLLRLWPSTAQARPVLGSRADLVQRFRDMIEQRYRQQPALPDLAHELGVSVSQLRLACTTVAGIPPIQILHDRLLTEAKQCLSYTPMSVSEIALLLGFSDAPYFSRFFSKAAGVPPSTYRKQHAPGFA